MDKSNTHQKKERNDVYTSFAVLSLFLVFGFFILRSNNSATEGLNEWVEQPVAPTDFSGNPHPHDDQSMENALPIIEEVDLLPQRTIQPVSSDEHVTKTVIERKTAGLSETAVMTEEGLPRPEVSTSEIRPATLEAQPTSDQSSTQDNVEQKAVSQANAQAKTQAQAKVEAERKEKLAPVVPAAKPNAASAKPEPASVPVKTSDAAYISSELPCVWVVGVFKNPKNVEQVVERLRINNFASATGAHEKGTYVGVPCACTGARAKAEQLRGIFAAQPWLLRK